MSSQNDTGQACSTWNTCMQMFHVEHTSRVSFCKNETPNHRKHTMQRILAAVALTAVLAPAAHAQDKYTHGPDSMEQDGVPRGEVIKFRHKSEVFAKTERDCAVHI